MEERAYIAIDLKSFYASVECMERGLDPMATNLVVADASKTEKTICLAVSPSMKEYGISGRARLFEVVQTIKQVNARRRHICKKEFSGTSFLANELQKKQDLSVSYIVAPPQMGHYMEVSAEIYKVYLKYVAPEDIHIYSIDEVFIDATSYLKMYQITARELAKRMMQDVLSATGVTATAGIGTNLYLCKIAMDIVAKHILPDEDGVRVAQLDEQSYRRVLWAHRPLTDFWRIGKGYAKKLEAHGLYTMGDIARCSLGKPQDFYNEALLYKLFGINAELLIDHAWGIEPCTMADIKAYKPQHSSICSGQVLQEPYPFDKARLIVREMADLLSLDLADKELVTNQIVLTVGYDIENLTNAKYSKKYKGEITKDPYGRSVPKAAHGTQNLSRQTNSTKKITQAVTELFERIVDETLLVRRVTITANKLIGEADVVDENEIEQLDLFIDYEALKQKRIAEQEALKREKRVQKAVLSMKKKYGKNAVVKGMNLQKGATTIERNRQIGGHKE